MSMNGGDEELYDLDADISETDQLTNEAQHQRLKELSNRWKSQLMDPVFLGLMQNDEYNKLNPDRFELEPY